ncbi:glycosyltransferase [Nocardioides sp. SYSU D00038]|uniref:glycosyltransferase n=1 Tax=Nocardioides sp. SYSU D00038 TaxID=2812554 RepID=UPI00196766E2|nr:glycosyltransferase [Nocardioides sp. SYSU D00038]
MLIDRFRGHDPELAVPDAVAELAALDLPADPTPLLLPVVPVLRANPFQQLLYSGLAARNIRPLAAFTLQRVLELRAALPPDAPRMLVHLHWLSNVMSAAEGPGQAARRSERFLSRLAELREQGAAVLWTVHNVLPHDARFPELETELHRRVAEQVDLVHVMSPRTRELMAPLAELPAEHTFRVPHPSYVGVYPQYVSRAQARAELGLPEDAVVFLQLGRVAPYKGTSELVAAAGTLAAERSGRVHLVIAGDPVPGEATDAVRAAAADHPSLHGFLGRVPDPQLQVFLAAADVMALPYRASLNSGALHLALGAGLPVVLPRSSGEAAGADPAWAEVYDDADPAGLLGALRSAADRLVGPAPAAAARAAVADVAPPLVAAAFADVLRHWADTGTVPADRRA